jgi:hypothetical protein
MDLLTDLFHTILRVAWIGFLVAVGVNVFRFFS